MTVLLLTAAGEGNQVITDTAPRLEFEVASIKPSKAGGDGGGIKPLPGGRTYTATNVRVKLMIKQMFHLNISQTTGGPSQLDTDMYDVEAKANGPTSIDELLLMFQNLLVDRFKVKYPKETLTIGAHELVINKSGTKFKENPNPEHFDIPFRPTGFGNIEATHCSMPYFSWVLSSRLDRPVINRTGLTQFYDFKLKWSPELTSGIAG